MKTNKLITLLTASILLVTSIFGQNYYVNKSATGNKAGTNWTSAYTSLPSTLVRGATYYLADGDYGSRNFADNLSGAKLITIKKATIADHGTDIGWQDSFGDGLATFHGGLTFSRSYYVIDGYSKNGDKECGIYSKFDGIGVYANGSSLTDITIKYVKMEGHGDDAGTTADNSWPSNKGFYIVGSGYLRWVVSHCYILNLGNMPFQWASLSDSIVEYCWVENNESTDAAHAEGIYGFGNNNIIRYSTWVNIEGTGVIMISGSGWQVYGNLIYSNGKSTYSGTGNGSIADWSDSSTASYASNNKIYNNTFANLKGYNNGISFIHTGSSGNVAINNIFYNCANVGFSQVDNQNSQIVDASYFVDPANFNFRLKKALSGINLASPYNSDMDGNTRGKDGVTDKGAFEYDSGSTVVISNVPPTVTITSPADGSFYTSPANIVVNVSSSDSDGSVSKVELLTNSVVILTKTTAPYTFTLTNVLAGKYVLSTKAYDNSNSVSTAIATIVVTNSPVIAPCTNYVYITNYVDKYYTNTVYVDKWLTNNITVTNFVEVIPDLSSIFGNLNKTNKQLDIKVNFK